MNSQPHRWPLLLIALLLSGCALSREAQLERQAGRVESSLKKEQSRVLSLSRDDPERAQRLDHLTQLRMTLSAANIALGASDFIPEAQRAVAYDVLEETYSTIDWNIPLGPGDQKRSLPARFTNGVLELNGTSPSPAQSPATITR